MLSFLKLLSELFANKTKYSIFYRAVSRIPLWLGLVLVLPVSLLIFSFAYGNTQNQGGRDTHRTTRLRYNSLLLYFQMTAELREHRDVWLTSRTTASKPLEFLEEMVKSRNDLRLRHPQAVALTDSAWYDIQRELTQTGQIQRETELRWIAAVSRMAEIIASETDQRSQFAHFLLMVGLVGIVVWAFFTLHLLHRLHRVETNLRADHRFIDAILQTVGALVIVLDTEGKIVRFNRACEQLTGYTEAEVAGQVFWEIFVPPPEQAGVQKTFSQLRSGAFPNTHENHWHTRHGINRLISWSNTALTDPHTGVVTFVIGTGVDITIQRERETHLQATNTRLEILATHDGLTGTYNRRVFDEHLEAEWEQASRYHRPLSLLLIDVDKFKSFNDTFGHPAGDEVLLAIACIFAIEVRVADFVARYGGEEFAILLPETDVSESVRVAERLRRAVESASWQQRAITISIGIATVTPEMTEPRQLLEFADNALYRAKKTRNRVCHALELPV